MKNILFFVAVVFSLQSFAQKYVVTQYGLRSSSDSLKTYLVLDIKGKSAIRLYNNAYKYINESYKNPESTIKGQIQGEYLKFETFAPDFIHYNNSGVKIPIQANYTTELSFKDEKVKYEISSLDMIAINGSFRVLFSGGLFEGYIVYKKNGKLFKADAKVDIEDYFQLGLNNLIEFLEEKNESNEW